MFTCPNCRKRLVRTNTPHGFCYVCPDCHGRAAALSVLRRAIGPQHVKKFWLEARGKHATSGRRCPVCDRGMRVFPVSVEGREFPLDLCARCQFVWFDPREFESFPPAAPEVPAPSEKDLPEKAREQIALARLKVEEERARLAGEDDTDAPAETWKWIPGVLGMPVEEDVPAVQSLPWMTWGLSALLVAVFAATVGNLEAIVERLGLVPSRLIEDGGTTLLTSFFLHGGLLHLIGNVYFLLIFGDNVEDYLGRVRFVLLVVAAAVVGDLAHVAIEPRSDIPCIGASGGISGIIVFYALKFPHARLGMLMRWFYYFRWVYMPAFTALILWLVLQCFTAWQQAEGATPVSAAAHLGGAAVGLVAWLAWGDGWSWTTFRSLHRRSGPTLPEKTRRARP